MDRGPNLQNNSHQSVGLHTLKALRFFFAGPGPPTLPPTPSSLLPCSDSLCFDEGHQWLKFLYDYCAYTQIKLL